MQNTINNLSLRLRETFILHWYKEQSYQEIAQQLNISYDNVRKRISQARAILRQRLSEYEGEETCAASPSRKQRQPIKTNILASSGDQEQVLTVASNSPKNIALSVETTQHYQSSHYELPLQAGNEKSETQPEILPPAKFAPIESVLGEAESDGKLEEIEIVRGEIEAVLLVGQPAPIFYQFNLTVKQWRGVGTGSRGSTTPTPQNPRFPENETALPLRRESEDNFSFRGGWGGAQLVHPQRSLVLALGCKSSVGKVKKRPSLIWEILELFELRWLVWADSGGCWLSSL
ncbi:MAG: sigma-70 family RNA polymerase sigma factor [Microcoleus sp.]